MSGPRVTVIYGHDDVGYMSGTESDGQFKDLTFEELCEVVGAIAAEYGMVRVYLIGSRARGDNRPDSDYDFCVLPPKGAGLFKMTGFFVRLEEALGTEVDIVSENVLTDDDFSRGIIDDRRLLYERDSGYGIIVTVMRRPSCSYQALASVC